MKTMYVASLGWSAQIGNCLRANNRLRFRVLLMSACRHLGFRVLLMSAACRRLGCRVLHMSAYRRLSAYVCMHNGLLGMLFGVNGLLLLLTESRT